MTTDINAQTNSMQDKFTQLEKETGVHVGVAAINTADKHAINHRANQRFPIQSTFKLMLVAAILKESTAHPDLLKHKITYSKGDLIYWSPVTEKHLADGMTIFDLCAAAMMHSDNTAANLLMKKLGGPKVVNQFARSIGDDTFRIDNWEPNLNSNPKDSHDSSTPTAMKNSLQKLLLGNVLSDSQREQLVNWMKGNTTGGTRIRAGVPKGWTVADKTGAGDSFGISNDIGLIWPPKGKPIIVAIYTIQNNKDAHRRDDVVASATKILIEELTDNAD